VCVLFAFSLSRLQHRVCELGFCELIRRAPASQSAGVFRGHISNAPLGNAQAMTPCVPPEVFLRGLASLGISAAQQQRCAHHVTSRCGAEGWDGAVARIEQLRSGVADDFLPVAKARRLLLAQPELLVRKWSVIHEDERLVVLEKPCDVRMSIPKGAHWPGEESVQDWCVTNHPSTLTDGGDARLCHNLDFATSGILVAAKSSEYANDVSKVY